MIDKNQDKDILEELSNAPHLSKLKGKNPFKVPISYFDTLEEDILSEIYLEEAGHSKNRNRTIFLRYIAAASLVLLLSYSLFELNKKQKSKDTFVAKSTQPKVKIQQEQKKVLLVDRNLRQNNKQKLVLEKGTGDSKNKISQYQSIKANNSKKNNSNETSVAVERPLTHHQKIANTAKKVNFKENEQKAMANANTMSAAYVVNSPSSPKIIRSARVMKKKSNSSNYILPHDTCVDKSFVYTMAKHRTMDSAYRFQWAVYQQEEAITIDSSRLYKLFIFLGDSLFATDSMFVIIVPLPKPIIHAQKEQFHSQSLLISSGTNNKNYTYHWSVSPENSSEIYVDNLSSGVHIINLRITTCADTVNASIPVVVSDCNVEVPNVITPNGDGYNDKFYIKGLDLFPGSSLTIIDRNGKLIYQSMNYKNNWQATSVPSGSYFYSLKINNKDKTEKQGTLNVLK